MKHGDFSDLAENYSKYRPGYSNFVVEAACSVVIQAFADADVVLAADVGAGTGIFSRMLLKNNLKVSAVEPNDEMRSFGEQDCKGDIPFVAGTAEATGLADSSVHFVSMASSFHWPDFGLAVNEFKRILVPGGYFLSIWNTRAIEKDPFTVDVEDYLKKLVPELKRRSSGRSEFCDSLHDRLMDCGVFEDVVYLEGFHTEEQSIDRYLGLWESVNDVRVQAGAERFGSFLQYIKDASRGMSHVNAHYQTRAWLAKAK
ncbi:class I SAM-dependent methyltransferase [Maridesulfovibrio sp.]|uniref:class I SAM-dependent methyltransferase n=1 Tax=Maridesulfovibrio sp. TaxID=2795000 RepID=UPI0039EFB5FE